ncbi:MAG TPA: 4Fe-4S dicluster domain-containing protein [Acidimicrobiales bacterium]|nr:4Fe-4S dicluster domain-containing protein [Acidimicrobiales bacterium]
MTILAAEEARAALEAMAERCRPCFQCGQCRSACPLGQDMVDGPRRVIRLVLAGDLGRLLATEDVWRCSDCGGCTRACPMEVDVAAVMAEVRALQQTESGPRCPERGALRVAARRLRRKPTIDAVAFGAAMAARGFIPDDLVDAASQGVRRVARRLRRPARPTSPAGAATLFYAGCALAQDPGLCARTHSFAADLELTLADAVGAGCCGHPVAGQAPASLVAAGSVVTACPACDRALGAAGVETTPLWQVLVETARREGRKLEARAARFVPYVGCLADRDAALGLLAEAAELAGVQPVMAYPTLHAGCCGGLGGVYRGPSEEVRALVEFAAAQSAPVVTPCLLCRDNVRSAAKRSGGRTDAYFWPEFFWAAKADKRSGGTDA